MNDSPGWASPGSSSSDPHSTRKGAPDDDQERTSSEAAPTPPADEPPRNWSAQQPPASPGQGWGQGGQGPAQGQGGPARGPGWGGPPPPHGGGPQRGGWNNNGWNAGWTQPPQAAKPGVIPLRPLGIGEILDGSVSTMRAHWRVVLAISLAVAVITEIVSAVTMAIWFRDGDELDALANNENPSLEDLNNALTGALGSTSVTAVIGILGTVIATSMLTVVFSRAVLGRPITMGEAWRDSRPQLLRLLGLLILVPLLVTAAMLVCLVPGLLAVAAGSTMGAAALLLLGFLGGVVAAVWLWVRYCLAAPALMLEKQGVIASMRRSAKLVRGSWWRILGIQLLALVLVFFISSVIQLPTTLIATLVSGDGNSFTSISAAVSWSSLTINGFGSVIASTIALPLSAGITALLYLDQRIRREALDIELARAAGVPGYDRPASGTGQQTPGS